MNKNVIIIALIGVVAIAGWFIYQESQKRPYEKAAEQFADDVEDAADEIARELED